MAFARGPAATPGRGHGRDPAPGGAGAARRLGRAHRALPEGRWRDVLTGGEVAGGAARIAALLDRLPVALLVAPARADLTDRGREGWEAPEVAGGRGPPTSCAPCGSSCGRRRRTRSSASSTRAAADAARDRRTAWWSVGPRARHGDRLRVLRRRRRPAARPAQRLAARRACTGPAGSSTPSRITLAGRRLGRARRPRRACSTSCTSGTFTAEGTLDAAIERLDHLVDLGVDVVELMPVAASTAAGAGATTGSPSTRCTSRTAARPRCSASSTPRTATAWPSAWTSSTTTSAPAGNYLAEFGPYFTERHHTPWGAAVNLDDEGSAGSAAGSATTRCAGCATSTSTRCAWTPSTPWSTTPPGTCWPSCRTRSRQLAAELGRPLALVAESDLNDPRMIEPTAGAASG